MNQTSANNPSYRLVLVEDDSEALSYLVSVFEGDERFTIVATCDLFQSGLDALREHRPDILLTDLGLPDGSGEDLIRYITQQELATQAMVISGFQDEHRVFAALEAGACGYIHKQDRQQDVADAVDLMMLGGSPISPVIARLMLKRFPPQQAQTTALPEVLTERQIRILRFVSQGFSSREIGEKLGISYYTVTTHIKNIYSKLQVNCRAEAINEAYKMGLMD